MMSDSSERPNGYTDPKFTSGGPGDTTIIIYGYTPDFALCVVALVVFFLSLIAHCFQVFRYKTYFFVPLVVGCVTEIVGYISRSLSARKDPYRLVFFIIQYFFIVVAPVFISASIYVCLNRLTAWSSTQGFERRWLRPKAILWAFITIDVVCTLMQVAGAGLSGKAFANREDPSIYEHILLAGLAFQTFAFSIFLILLAAFTGALVKDRSIGGRLGGKRQFFVALGLASLLVFLRTIFRLIETAVGLQGYLSTHEIFFAMLDFFPVAVAVLVLAIWHPGRWVRATADTRQATDLTERNIGKYNSRNLSG